jgi:hypothetical protein
MASPPESVEVGGGYQEDLKGEGMLRHKRMLTPHGDTGASAGHHPLGSPAVPCCVTLAYPAPSGGVRFSDKKVEVIRVESTDWSFTRQVIPYKRRHSWFGVNESDYKIQSCRPHAEARRRAVDLANGGGRIDDVDDPGDWEGVVQVSANDVRRLPLIREGDKALILADYADGFVSYGRTPDKCPRIVASRIGIGGLCSALEKRGLTLSDFEHTRGSFAELCPVEVPCHPVRIASPWLAPPSFSTSLLAISSMLTKSSSVIWACSHNRVVRW